jgi:Malectin-like domain
MIDGGGPRLSREQQRSRQTPPLILTLTLRPPPSLIMQTAATSSSTKDPLLKYWNSNNASTMFYVILHFSEIQNASRSRAFYIYSNGYLLFDEPFHLPWLTWQWASYVTSGFTRHNFTLVATSNSTLPPLLNGFELYKVAPVVGIPTYSGDGNLNSEPVLIN